MSETRDVRIKRLKLRSMRRGIKEMDLILSQFSQVALEEMPDAGLDTYDVMLEENDHDLYQWVTGQAEPPVKYVEMIEKIANGFKV